MAAATTFRGPPAGTAPPAPPPPAPPPRLFGLEEYSAIEPRPGVLLELVMGEVREMSLPKPRHGEVAMEIARLLANHARAGRSGKVFAAETGFVTTRNPDSVRGADVAFVGAERLARVTTSQGWYPVVPDLVVEVASPDDRPAAVAAKIAHWLAAGVRLLWQVDPALETVEVHRPAREPVTLGAADTIDGGDVLPGFACRVAEFFA